MGWKEPLAEDARWRQAGSNRVASRPLGASLAVRARSGTTVRVLFPAKAELDERESHVG